MNLLTAKDFVSYINTSGSRFAAEALEYTDRVWVLVRDKHASPTAPSIEPILDVATYLTRKDRYRPIDPDLHVLLARWQVTANESHAVPATGT